MKKWVKKGGMACPRWGGQKLSKGVTGSSSSKSNSKSVKSKSGCKEKVGRPKSLNKEELERLLDIYYSQPVSIRVLAKMFGVSRMTIWRMVCTNR